MGLLGAVRRRWEAARMRWARPPWLSYIAASGRIDYRKELDETVGHSTAMAPLLWVARTFPEAPPQVLTQLPDGQLEPMVTHPMVELLRRPNPFFSGVVLWAATVIDYQAGGNAYWIKIRDRQRRVGQLWWVPSWMIAPEGPPDGSAYITHYAYRVAGETWEVPPTDVVHFRFGLDPHDPRRGLSPLASVVRELFTDQEAAAFTAALLRNMGIPGLLITPEGANEINAEEAERVKRYVQSHFRGDRRGEALVMGAATKLQQFGFSPDQLNLTSLRRIPEERVSAVLGVPAVVAGLGAGLDRSTFTNMGEAREMAYESNIVPTQRAFAEELRYQLLPDFEPDPMRFEVAFDLSRVRVLQEDRNKHAQRVTAVVNGGVATLAEGRRDLGLPVDETHEVFLRPVNVVAVPAGTAVGSQADGGGLMRDQDLARVLDELRAAADRVLPNGNGGSDA